MRPKPLHLLVAVLLIAVVAAGYLISDTVPIFVIAVLGLPVAAFFLNRMRLPDSE
jgi:hypothetical protein